MDDTRFAGVRVHPTAIIEEGVEIGPGTVIWDNVHIRRNARLGRSCIIGEKSYIAYDVVVGNLVKINAFVYIPTGVVIEDCVMISAGTVFTNDKLPRAATPEGDSLLTSGPTEETLTTTVREGVTIGAGAVIGPGLELGRYAMIGMGAVVTRNVAPFQLVLGNPARLAGFVCRCGAVLTRESVSSPSRLELRCSRCNRPFLHQGECLKERAPSETAS